MIRINKRWIIFSILIMLMLLLSLKLSAQEIVIYAFGQQKHYETFGEWDNATEMTAYRSLKDYETIDSKQFDLPFDEARGYISYFNSYGANCVMHWRLYPDRYVITLYRKKGSIVNLSLVNFTLQDAHLSP